METIRSPPVNWGCARRPCRRYLIIGCGPQLLQVNGAGLRLRECDHEPTQVTGTANPFSQQIRPRLVAHRLHFATAIGRWEALARNPPGVSAMKPCQVFLPIRPNSPELEVA